MCLKPRGEASEYSRRRHDRHQHSRKKTDPSKIRAGLGEHEDDEVELDESPTSAHDGAEDVVVGVRAGLGLGLSGGCCDVSGLGLGSDYCFQCLLGLLGVSNGGVEGGKDGGVLGADVSTWAL